MLYYKPYEILKAKTAEEASQRPIAILIAIGKRTYIAHKKVNRREKHQKSH